MTGTAAAELMTVPMDATPSANEIYSGVARLAGTLWCTRHRAQPGRLSDVAVVVMHPSSNFMGHYALEALAASGVDAIGMTTRYIGNDTALLLENCVLDVASVVRHLRNEGYGTVVLFGNSGGGALAALYQSQAESATIRHSPGGGGPDLTVADLPPADLVALAMAHPGRAQLLAETLDPAVLDEDLPFERDPALDMFNPDNGPPFDGAWLDTYRQAQVERNHRITDWTIRQLDVIEERRLADLPFLVHGVCADPRNIDLTIEPTDREAGTLWGEPWNANFQPATLGHYTTVRAWLSQWSLRESNGDSRVTLKSVQAPVHIYYGTADQSCFPSHAQSMFDAISHDDKVLTPIIRGKHYLHGQPDQIRQLTSSLTSWIRDHGHPLNRTKEDR